MKDKKKLIIIIAAVVVAIALIVLAVVIFSGNEVKTTVPQKYADGYAEKYAQNKTVDDDGNITYEFEDDKYDEFVKDYHEAIKEESRDNLKTVHHYTHYNLKDVDDEANYGIVVGISKETYEEIGEETLKAEANELAQAAIKFQMNTESPATEIPVTYRDSATGDEFFKITVSVQ